MQAPGPTQLSLFSARKPHLPDGHAGVERPTEFRSGSGTLQNTPGRPPSLSLIHIYGGDLPLDIKAEYYEQLCEGHTPEEAAAQMCIRDRF